MVTFTCPSCNQERTGERRRCYPCTVKHTPESRERIRQSLLGRTYDETRRENSREGLRRKRAEGWTGFDIGALTRGKPSPRRKPVGSTRVGNGHIQIKCEDGKWRYRARVVWEAANGPIPRGLLIHHRNEDPFDDRLENLQMVTRAEHAAIHHTPDKMRERQLASVAVRKGRERY